MKMNIALLPGDGIGPEVIAQAVKVVEAIGKKFGLTRERVRQMEQQALEKLYRTMSREFGEQRPLER